ncbi:hypothetical protein PoB_003170900 [Plakobranchus ocellatus]|uniref:Uncharacterized protein n=1 Tax=Plakobranchus ocellatus TaxID=259542 RepID=A0AAV4AG26_9GAST|nr:hypothetical protein PoB_003170900 [Plakobranchus ocellatus]
MSGWIHKPLSHRRPMKPRRQMLNPHDSMGSVSAGDFHEDAKGLSFRAPVAGFEHATETPKSCKNRRRVTERFTLQHMTTRSITQPW